MTNKKKYLAVIPARGGSKRLPRKNILPLGGKPLISWSIEAALGCSSIDKIVVSSDDAQILAVAEGYEVNVLKRPEYLATDMATSFDVIKHAIGSNPGYEFVLLLQPTSPLRTSQHVAQAIKLLEEKNAHAIISVCEAEHNPLWTNTLPADRDLKNFLQNELHNVRSQDLRKYYRLNGAIYICKIDDFLKESSFFLKNNIYAFIMDNQSSIDIDTSIDFKFADFLVNELFKDVC